MLSRSFGPSWLLGWAVSVTRLLLVVPDPRHSQAALLRPDISLRFVAHGPAGIFLDPAEELGGRSHEREEQG